MKKTIIAISAAIALSGCTAAQVNTALQTPTGQLFCAIQTNGGGTVVVGLINAEAAAVAGAAAPVAVIATGLAKATVDADCAAAGKSAGGTGIAVSPPANPAAAPQVAVVAAQ